MMTDLLEVAALLARVTNEGPASTYLIYMTFIIIRDNYKQHPTTMALATYAKSRNRGN